MTVSNDLNISEAGYVVFDGISEFSGRTFQQGFGISLTNASGVSGNTTISVNPVVIPVGLIIVKSNAVADITVMGTTQIFTFPQDFVCLYIIYTNLTLTGSIAGSAATIGTNNPDYDNLGSPSFNLSAQGNIQYYAGAQNAVTGAKILSGSTVFLNVTVPDGTATSLTETVDFIGYYV